MSSVSAVESARGGIRTWAPAWTADGATGGSPITVGETWRPPWPSWMQGCAPVEAMARASGARVSAAPSGHSQAMAFSTRPSGATAENPTVASAVPWLRVR